MEDGRHRASTPPLMKPSGISTEASVCDEDPGTVVLAGKTLIAVILPLGGCTASVEVGAGLPVTAMDTAVVSTGKSRHRSPLGAWTPLRRRLRRSHVERSSTLSLSAINPQPAQIKVLMEVHTFPCDREPSHLLNGERCWNAGLGERRGAVTDDRDGLSVLLRARRPLRPSRV